MTKRGLVIALVAAGVPLLTGCATGDDAVAQGGTFEFVAPGGKTDIFYDPPESRGRPGPVSGPNLMDPSQTMSLDDFAGKVVVINVWGQWCGPCRAEITELQQVYDATRDRRRRRSWASTCATTTGTPQRISSSTARSPSRRSTTRRCAP